MCYGKPYHTAGKKQQDFQNSWYECLECGCLISHQKNPYIKCSRCGGILKSYICSKCGMDYTEIFNTPVDFDAIP